MPELIDWFDQLMRSVKLRNAEWTRAALEYKERHGDEHTRRCLRQADRYRRFVYMSAVDAPEEYIWRRTLSRRIEELEQYSLPLCGDETLEPEDMEAAQRMVFQNTANFVLMFLRSECPEATMDTKKEFMEVACSVAEDDALELFGLQ